MHIHFYVPHLMAIYDDTQTVKVVVVANPANTNCLICATNAPSIPKENFSALTRLDFNRYL